MLRDYKYCGTRMSNGRWYCLHSSATNEYYVYPVNSGSIYSSLLHRPPSPLRSGYPGKACVQQASHRQW